MNILHVAAEFFPLLKTGGLADVMGALPKAQATLYPQSDVRILLPGFPAILKGLQGFLETEPIAVENCFAGDFKILLGTFNDLRIYVIKADQLYGREGSPYHDPTMVPYSDNHLRFALLGWVASEMACGTLDRNWKADVVHAHDWHAGMSCAYLKAKGNPATSVFTIHNLAYQGVFPEHYLNQLNMPDHFYQMHGLEFYGNLSFQKAGIFYADHITTVSPSYAQEITQFDSAFGLHGLLSQRKNNQRLTGILNGVDDEIWHPNKDELIASNYTINKMEGKKICKTQLQHDLGLPITDNILFGVVGRFTEQKGLDWVLHSLPTIIKEGGQIALLGTGDLWLEQAFLEAARNNPEHVAVHIGHDDKLAHQFISGVDVVLVPSRFEPCGLTQLYALKYGSIPLVRFTGGLADTVIDCDSINLKNKTATGFVFKGYGKEVVESAIERACALWLHPNDWRNIQMTAMKNNFGWNIAAEKYINLYQSFLPTYAEKF
jgi:starch synthase